MEDRPDIPWFRAGIVCVVLITLYRVAFLWIDRTDLFVDESQYWLWSRSLEFGYYSKPPLIAWIIRLFTGLAGSDAVFWVRLPAPLFHCATAMILGLLGRDLFGVRAAFWIMVSYITLPAVVLGSAVISTDTMMAPFYALALFFYLRLLADGKGHWALLAGLSAGVAFLAKYAGIYFLLCAALAALFMPSARPSWRHAGLLLLAFAAVALPNVLWNFGNDLSTFEHTLDNADWVRGSADGVSLHLLELAEFFFSQFGVFGPILFGALLVCVVQPGGRTGRLLLFFSVPVIAIVCVQALLSQANANWAAAGYFAATVVVVAAMLERGHRRLLTVSVAIGLFATVAMPVLTSIAYNVSVDGEKPALKRLLGRQQMSRDILAAARTTGADAIVARSRDIVADLFYTGQGEEIAVRMLTPPGRPKNYYQLKYPFRADEGFQRVLLVSRYPTVACGAAAVEPVSALTTRGGAYHGGPLNVFLLDPGCVDDLARS